MDDLITGLPGEALVREGLADIQAGRHTVPACLVDIARTRLSRAGVVPHGTAPQSANAELELYRLLRSRGGDAYSRYNSLVRELVSFEMALERRMRRRAQEQFH